MDLILDILLLPLQAILIPIDAILSQITGLEVIPQSINAVTSLIGTIPSTLVYISGINPLLWNGIIAVAILNLTAVPSINVIKRVWAWVKPT